MKMNMERSRFRILAGSTKGLAKGTTGWCILQEQYNPCRYQRVHNQIVTPWGHEAKGCVKVDSDIDRRLPTSRQC